jgi:hypothetical protein
MIILRENIVFQDKRIKNYSKIDKRKRNNKVLKERKINKNNSNYNFLNNLMEKMKIKKLKFASF